MNVELQQSFFKDQQARFSPETIRTYKIALKQFFSFCRKEYDEVQARDIRNWLANLTETGLQPLYLAITTEKGLLIFIILVLLHFPKPQHII